MSLERIELFAKMINSKLLVKYMQDIRKSDWTAFRFTTLSDEPCKHVNRFWTQWAADEERTSDSFSFSKFGVI